MSEDPQEKSAFRLVVLLGMVSLCADMTYEGAWSVAGSFLASLGASGAMVGFLGGFGELVGHALRLISGALVDRTKRYWGFTIFGYSINLLTVPLLSTAFTWPAAALLLMLERVGKAVRAPAKDVILSHGASRIGTSFGFGLHEAMDQTGALCGPLLMAWALSHWGNYRAGFQLLAIPAALALAALLTARWQYPKPQDLEKTDAGRQVTHFSRTYWLFLGACALMAAGFADFALIAFHLEKQKVFASSVIPVLYAMAMAIDGISAVMMGRWLDKVRLQALMVVCVVVSCAVGLMFMGSRPMIVAGLAVWGMGLGAIGSLVKATVAKLAPGGKRGSAYGYYHTAFGGGWFLGSMILGQLYDRSMSAMAATSAGFEVAAVALFYLAIRETKLQKAA